MDVMPCAPSRRIIKATTVERTGRRMNRSEKLISGVRRGHRRCCRIDAVVDHDLAAVGQLVLARRDDLHAGLDALGDLDLGAGTPAGLDENLLRLKRGSGRLAVVRTLPALSRFADHLIDVAAVKTDDDGRLRQRDDARLLRQLDLHARKLSRPQRPVVIVDDRLDRDQPRRRIDLRIDAGDRAFEVEVILGQAQADRLTELKFQAAPARAR